jgi:hypothetical protein
MAHSCYYVLLNNKSNRLGREHKKNSRTNVRYDSSSFIISLFIILIIIIISIIVVQMKHSISMCS